MAAVRDDGVRPLLLYPRQLLAHAQPAQRADQAALLHGYRVHRTHPGSHPDMGSENFFYGSDYPHGEFMKLPNYVNAVTDLDGITERDKENILGRTMLTALKRE